MAFHSILSSIKHELIIQSPPICVNFNKELIGGMKLTSWLIKEETSERGDVKLCKSRGKG